MKISALFGSSTGTVAATAAGAVLLVAGAIGYSIYSSNPDRLDLVSPSADTDSAPDLDPDAETTVPVADAAPEGEAQSVGPSAPLLDVVRVEPDGNTLIAGQTEPGLAVAILLDGAEVAVTDADASGAFVALLTLPPSDAPRMISAEVRPEGAPAVPGPESVLVAPFALASAAPAAEASPTADGEAASADTDPSIAPEGQPETAENAPDVSPLPDTADPGPFDGIADLTAPDVAETPGTSTAPIAARPALTTPEPSQSPAVLIAGPEGIRIAQGPGTPDVQTEVLLDAISYDAEGAVILAGRGPATADIQIYLNNQPIQLGEVGQDGAWSLELPDVDPGTYTLSVAELAPNGSVESRVETPFLREDPERVAEAPVQAATEGIDVITVQPGFTLWGIAENRFGEGIQYVQIFEENRDQIRDPDWIFPGQIFRLPELEGDPGQN